jgi:hypothetical protein
LGACLHFDVLTIVKTSKFAREVCPVIRRLLIDFHALYGGDEALFDLRDLHVMRGSLPRRAMALVLEWAAEHREELMEDWNLCSQLKTPKAIEPLR